MANRQPLTMVIRIPDVKISRAELNSSLKLDADRYEDSRHHAGKYAQIDIADSEDQWQAAILCVQSVSKPIRELLSAGLIGTPTLDVALALPDSSLTRSWIIPADLAAAAGGAGIDIEVSVYLSSEVDAPSEESGQ
jgi:hypothetical protein